MLSVSSVTSIVIIQMGVIQISALVAIKSDILLKLSIWGQEGRDD